MKFLNKILSLWKKISHLCKRIKRKRKVITYVNQHGQERTKLKWIKENFFDVEYIHNIATDGLFNYCNVSSHRIMRGLTLKQLNKLIKANEVPIGYKGTITLNIRGVNHE